MSACEVREASAERLEQDRRVLAALEEAFAAGRVGPEREEFYRATRDALRRRIARAERGDAG